LLIAYFYRELTDGLEPPAELAARLSKHSWPGNVRELRAAVERAIVLGDETIPEAPSTRQDVHFDPAVPFRVAKERAIAAWEKEWIAELVRRHGGNLSEASRAAKTDRTYLRELLRKHRIATRDE